MAVLKDKNISNSNSIVESNNSPKDVLIKQLKKLYDNGVKLQFSMYKECGVLTEEQEKELKDKILLFHNNYQTWYSESREVVKQILPNRIDDFTAFYRSKDKRKSVDFENYTIQDYLMGTTTKRGFETIVEPKAAIPKFQQQLLILGSAYELIDSKLIDIYQVLQADIFDSELDASRHLSKNGFLRAAGAMAGVVIESHLQQVCISHNIKITKANPGINDLAQLLKDNSVLGTPEWRKIQQLADLRNLCDHKKKVEPTKEQIEELIVGAEKIIKTVF